MIRCYDEIIERISDKKGEERPADPRRPLVRVGFDEVLTRDAMRLFTLRTPDDLRRLADDMRVALRRHEFSRFTEWIERRYGTAFARRGGLAVGRPRLTLAS